MIEKIVRDFNMKCILFCHTFVNVNNNGVWKFLGQSKYEGCK